MYDSNYDIIETLCSIAPDHMAGCSSSAEEWLAEALENEDMTAWSMFAENNTLDGFDSLDDLRIAFEDFEADWLTDLWDEDAIVSAVESEIENVHGSLTDYLDCEEQYAQIQTIMG